MKKNVIASVLLAALSAGAWANGGQLDVTGEIVNASCTLDPNSQNVQVNLGKVSAAEFKAAGDKSAPVPFEMKLTGCDTATVKNVAVLFTGTHDGANADLLKTTGSATGVGIRLEDYLSGNGLKVGQYTKPVDLVKGDNTLRFRARYEATAASVTAGPANGSAQFDLRYN